MILFYGYGDDSSIVRALDAASRLGVEHLLVDQRYTDHHELWLAHGDGGVTMTLGGRLSVGGHDVPLAEVDGVYARPLRPLVDSGDERAVRRAEVMHEAMLDWLDVAPCRVASRPSAMHSNASKAFQIQDIAAVGLAVPTTLVTTEPEEVWSFLTAHRELIFKSVSGIRSIVRRLDTEARRRLDRIRALPTQFQAFVPGDDVRVHVVGGRVLATEIRSSVDDYRYARRFGGSAELVATEVPDAVADRCLALASRFDLPFCGVDLRRRPDGDWVCFEVNPMPGYSYFEEEAGQPISDALVEYLAGKSPGGRP